MARSVALIAALFVALAPAARADDPEPPGGSGKALKDLKGTWTVTRAIFGGREGKVPAGMTYAFDGDKLTRSIPFGKGNGDLVSTVKIDAKKKPYRITLTPQNEGVAQRFGSQTALFKIEKGELFLATSRASGKVPADFKGDDVAVMVMTRDKK